MLYAINTVLLYKNGPLLYAITCILGAICYKNRVWLLYAITIFGLLLYAISIKWPLLYAITHPLRGPMRALITVLHRDAEHRGEGRVDHRSMPDV